MTYDVASEWPKFYFFDKVSIQDPHEPAKKFSLKGLNVSFWANAQNFVLFGEPGGSIFRLSSDLEIQFWEAHQQKLLSFSLTGNLVTSIGYDEPDVPVLKMWDLSQWKRSFPLCKVNSRITVAKKKLGASVQACAVAVSPFHNFIAIGFFDSSVFYFYGDAQREKGMKYKSLRDGANALGEGQLTGLTVAGSECKEKVIVFVITDNSLSYYVVENGVVVRKLLDDHVKGCDRNCWFFHTSKNQLVVCDRENVYFYDVQMCLTVEEHEKSFGKKVKELSKGDENLQLVIQNCHVVLLKRPSHQRDLIQPARDNPALTLLTIFDVDCKFKAFSYSMPLACQLFLLDEDIYILNSEGVVSKLVEKPLKEKLDILFKKSLFNIAIQLVKRQNNTTDLQVIYKKYGDELYSKGDFNNAMCQYKETLGYVEPSYVIKKFLDGTRISQLCTYLEHIKQKNIAAPAHMTLLLGVYIKMDAKDKLKAFVNESTNQKGFDVEEAIQLLQSSGFSELAAKLALNHEKPDTFLHILIENTKDYKSALKFIAQLPVEQICRYLDQYGHMLVEHQEAELLEVVKKVVVSKNANIKQLVNVLINSNKAEHLEEVFREMSVVQPVKDVYMRNALLEHRLKVFAKKGNITPQKSASIIELVNTDNYEQALHLAQIYKFSPLIIHILKQQNRMEDMLRFLIKQGDISDIIQYCGQQDVKFKLENIWIELVTFVAAKENLEPEALVALLEKMSETTPTFVHPLVVLEILSRNNVLKVADVKDYIVKWLEKQNDLIKNNEAGIQLKEKRIEEMEKAIEDLENNVQIFQTTKCSVCREALSIPAVHFFCKHAFHYRCFEEHNYDQPDQCPLCVTARNSKDTDVDSTPKAMSHQSFCDELDRCTDPISFISHYISNGAFDVGNE